MYSKLEHTFGPIAYTVVTECWVNNTCIVDTVMGSLLIPFSCSFLYPRCVVLSLSILVSLQDYPKHRHPGWSKGSIGYHADDGKIFIGSGVGDPFGPRCHKGDRMGCGILFPRDYVCQYDR